MKDPRRIAFVINKLNGQQLTNNLVSQFALSHLDLELAIKVFLSQRQFIWSDILLRHERKKLDGNIQV